MELTPEKVREDIARYDRELAQALRLYPEDHFVVRLWLRRRRTAGRLLEHLEGKT